MFFNSCKKEEAPTLVTSPLTDITFSGAIGGGDILSGGTAAIIAKGVCWSTESFPTIKNDHTSNGAGPDSFVSVISGLSKGTTYYVRAYALNSVGTGYGEELKFTTLKQSTSVSTNPAINISTSGATLIGSITTNDLSTKVSFEYYQLFSDSNPMSTICNSPITINTNTMVGSNVSGLKPGTNYGFRIKAQNSVETVYGEQVCFTTLGLKPTVTTLAATNISSRGVGFNGFVTANLIGTRVYFEFGLTTSYGEVVEATQSPVNPNYSGNVSAGIQGLEPGKTYHFRIRASNSVGVSYGNDALFTTLSTR